MTSPASPFGTNSSSMSPISSSSSSNSERGSEGGNSSEHQGATASPPLPKSEESEKSEKSKRKEGKLRRLFRHYGAVAGVTYGGVYVATLASIYVLVRNDIIHTGDIMDLVNKLGVEEYLKKKDITLNAKTADFSLAWIATKLTEPLRLAFTISITPKIARMLGRAPPKEESTLQSMKKHYADAKESVKDARDSMKKSR